MTAPHSQIYFNLKLKVAQKRTEKEALIFLMMAMLIEKRNSLLIKVKKNVPHKI